MIEQIRHDRKTEWLSSRTAFVGNRRGKMRLAGARLTDECNPVAWRLGKMSRQVEGAAEIVHVLGLATCTARVKCREGHFAKSDRKRAEARRAVPRPVPNLTDA